jgi:hypothetical protein
MDDVKKVSNYAFHMIAKTVVSAGWEIVEVNSEKHTEQ